MSPIEGRQSETGISPALAAISRTWTLRAMFTAALFLSASLMFSVQPMFTKMVLPVLGGSPAVWSVAMVFFQGVLLAGYFYAHLLMRYLHPRTAAAIHLCLFFSAWLTLPIAANALAGQAPSGFQAFWLLGVFTVSLGLPFFALSANGPLLQAWFSKTSDPRAHDPYFLYGASNIGSFFALLAYPFLLEPWLGLKLQSQTWSAVFFLLGLLIGGCALFAISRGHDGMRLPVTPASGVDISARQTPTLLNFATWAALGFVPSGLLVSVTAYISTDIAAAPLLWVAPLALFLLTFVIAFRERPPANEKFLVRIQVVLSAIVLLSMTASVLPLAGNLAAHLALFFVSALICHRTLYGLRPAAQNLTLFYVAMSLGGVCGGIFSALGGPLVFSNIVEYPILVAAALFCSAGFVSRLKAEEPGQFILPLLTSAILLAIVLLPKQPPIMVAISALSICMIIWWNTPARLAVFTLSALALVMAQPIILKSESHRSFFGVHKIWEYNSGKFRVITHGTTIHGAIRIRNSDGTPYTGKPVPSTYYAFQGPIGEAIQSARAAMGSFQQIFAIGQGAGALACHRKDGESITFFEIDPVVAGIAGNRDKFRFMSDCAPDARVIIGDARLTVERETNRANVIVVDAFSSDAIPVHLLTREAFAVYLKRSTDNGVIIIHITNRTMNLTPIIARTATEHGLVVYERTDIVPDAADTELRASSVALALARKPEHLGPISRKSDWRLIKPDMSSRPWTDDFSTILPALLSKLRGG